MPKGYDDESIHTRTSPSGFLFLLLALKRKELPRPSNYSTKDVRKNGATEILITQRIKLRHSEELRQATGSDGIDYLVKLYGTKNEKHFVISQSRSKDSSNKTLWVRKEPNFFLTASMT